MPDEAAVAGFMPLPGEIDTVPLMIRLHDAGAKLALPVCVARDRPLLFRAWHPGLGLVPDAFKIPAPPDDCEEIEPDVLIVPLAAFDRAGQRLGWGAGFYDRTLAFLRARKKIAAVGVAFTVQEVDSVPHGAHDEPLDWVLTEREAIRIGVPA